MIKFAEETKRAPALLDGSSRDPQLRNEDATLASLQPVINALPNEYTSLVHRLFLSPTAAGRRLTAFVAVDTQAQPFPVCAQVARLLTYRTGHSASVLDLTGETPAMLQGFPKQPGGGGRQRERTFRLDNFRATAEDMTGEMWMMSGAETRKRVSLLAGSSGLEELVREIRKQFHYGFIVCPPFSSMIASLAICAECDSIVLVIGSRSKRSTAMECAKLLRSMDLEITGAVISGKLN